MRKALIEKLRGYVHALSLAEARSNTDPYKVLGVGASVTSDELKKKYRDLVKRNHPDLGGDTYKLAEINAAYDILSDPKRRREYDATFSGKSSPASGYAVHIVFGGRPKVNYVNSKKEAIDMVASLTQAKVEVTQVTDPSGAVIYKGNKHKL